jgi:hypothetical protein
MKIKYCIPVALFLLVSCKKEKKSETCILNGFSTPTGKLLTSIEYTKDGKIAKISNYDSTNGKVRNSTSFEFLAGMVTKKYNQMGNPETQYDYYLNDKGYAFLRVGKRYNDSVFFTYNTNGNLIESKNFYSLALYEKLKYINDGEKRILITNDIDTPKEKHTFTYYDFEVPREIKNALAMSSDIFGDKIDREIFIGKNTNLAVKNKEFWLVGDTTHQQVYHHQYKFDEKNRLKSIEVTVSYKYSYTLHIEEVFMKYDCK